MRSSKNIILNLQNITAHFTGKAKIITLVSVIIMLSFVSIINTSALSYSSSVNVGFTFNPTLSVSISSNDLIISSLAPGTTADSNNITVSVASNASYGYALSAMMNGGNSNLTHISNSINNVSNVFSSIATNADLTSLATDNTWGYSYKFSNDTNWNNYSGLSTETSKTLVDSNNQTTTPIDFKIAAKAGSTQPSGTYTGVINFTAVTKPTPMNLSESYFAAGKTRHNGYYAMQDMTTEICNNTEVVGEDSQTELIDTRDNKVYWATKLADGHCWMTQNLDLDIGGTGATTLTSENTDISVKSSTYTSDGIYTDYVLADGIYTWSPVSTTITANTTITYPNNTNNPTVSPAWPTTNYTTPYSADGKDTYYYTSNSTSNGTRYTSLKACTDASHTEAECKHYHAGNYYNWSAAIASNNSTNINTNNSRAANSICPKNWRLPDNATTDSEFNEFGKLLYNGYGITDRVTADGTGSVKYQAGGFIKMRSSPLYFVQSGVIYDSTLLNSGINGNYWSSTAIRNTNAYGLGFGSSGVWPANSDSRSNGRSIRCVAR